MIKLKIQVNTGFCMAMVYFKDSYKFINLPLQLLPKSFGFQNELQKGFFLHHLNTQANMNYRSDNLPEVDYFGVKEMSEDERSRFNSLYGTESERLRNEIKQYDLREEMIKYCYDDCGVLASAFASI